MSPHADVLEGAKRTLGRCHDAARRAGREPGSVCLIAVSKTVPRERALAVLEAGVGDLGENRVQEADEKWGGPGPPPARLHMVGRLQRNKARRAVELFGAIHSCDSHRLAERLSLVGEGRRVPVLLEVNVGGEASKAGFTAAELRGAFEALVALPNLRLLGLMTVAPATRDPEDARGCFVSLRRLGEELRRLSPSLGAELSMGMTDDFEVAIEEGATMVRVGRAIYGARPPA